MGLHWRLNKLTTKQAIAIIESITTSCDNLELFQMQIEFFNDIKKMLYHYQETTKALQTTLLVIQDNSEPGFMDNLQPEIDTYNTAIAIISED